MRPARDCHFVLTGAPGAGKTTLIRALRQRGLACVDEVARRVIQVQRELRGHDLREVDPALWVELVLQQDIANFLAADPEVPTVFDRGIVDAVGVADASTPATAHHRAAITRFRYAPMVFVAPPWEAIYHTDTERNQTLAEAIESHDRVCAAYAAAGYELIPLPLAAPETRADFVLRRIGLPAG